MKKQSKKMMVATRLAIIFLICLVNYDIIIAQQDSSAVNRKRLQTFVIASSVGYAATLTGLSALWYKDSEQRNFHFFNDNREWNQVDKIGHFYTAYYFSLGTKKSLQWAGVSAQKATLFGALTGIFILLPVEILDGYSASYGASPGDLLANASGSLFFLSQELLWKQQRVVPKFSFHRTDLAPMRPDVLGNDFPSELLKDYNGQTYWLSVDLDKFIRFPSWLNIAVGYGAHGMIYANNQQNINPFRQYYISLDPDLSSIQTQSKLLRTIFSLLRIIKIPSPTIEFSKAGTRFHPFYF